MLLRLLMAAFLSTAAALDRMIGGQDVPLDLTGGVVAILLLLTLLFDAFTPIGRPGATTP
jgi:hypothetical protein